MKKVGHGIDNHDLRFELLNLAMDLKQMHLESMLSRTASAKG